MLVHEIQHPRWGSNMTNQTVARALKGLGNQGEYHVTSEVVTNFLGWSIIRKKKECVGKGWVTTTDDNEDADRQYQHRCGLLKITMTHQRGEPLFVAFLDGHVASNFNSKEMEFRLAPDELKDNEGKPIVEVWFSGKGRRRGPLSDYRTSRIICTFADKEQMDQYLDLKNRRMPKSITHQGMTYSSTGGGTYQSSDGVMLPHLLFMYFLLSPDEQRDFKAQNPELQSLLGDTTQSVAGGDRSSDGESIQVPTTGANYSNDDYRSSDADLTGPATIGDIGGGGLSGGVSIGGE